MQKIAIIAAVLLLPFLMFGNETYAATESQNILLNKIFTSSTGRLSASAAKNLTDGDKNTIAWWTAPAGTDNAYYEFDTPQNIISGSITGITASFKTTFNLKDETGKVIYTLQVGNATYAIPAVNGVKRVEILGQYINAYGGTGISEVSLNGLQEVNPEPEKFVINNLIFTPGAAGTGALSWTPFQSDYFKEFRVYSGSTKLASVKQPNYSISGLETGKSYSWSVAAVDIYDKEYAWSTVKYTVPVPDTTPPDKVQGVKVQPSRTTALVTWTKSSADDLAGYMVFLNGQEASTSLIKSESFQLNGLKPETAYKVYVVAQDKAGNVSEKSDEVSFTATNPATDSDQEQTPDYILVTWTATPGAVSYEILLNGKVVGTAPADATTFKVTKAMGYNPQNMTNKTAVRAKFADGSTGGSNPGGGGWGFDGKDIWQNTVMLVGSLSIFLILGIVIKFAPRIFAMIRSAVRGEGRL